MSKQRRKRSPDDNLNDESIKTKKSKASKVLIACLPCKQSKLKCDDQTPCSQCAKRNRTNRCERPVPNALINYTAKHHPVSASVSSVELQDDKEIQLEVASNLKHSVPLRAVLSKLLEDYTGKRSPMSIHDLITNGPPINQ
jgi:hypothetical protein